MKLDHCHVRLLRPQLRYHTRPSDQVHHEDDDHGVGHVNDIHENYINWSCEEKKKKSGALLSSDIV